MPHIHVEENQHDHTVSAFIVRWIAGEPCVLLVMHKKHHLLLQPGGHVELDETPWQAISHELVEETGYEFSQLKVYQPKDMPKSGVVGKIHPVPALSNTHPVDNVDPAHHHTDWTYVFTTDEDALHEPEDGESTDLRWLTMNEINMLDETVMYPDVKVFAKYVLDTVLKEWHQVDTDKFEL